MNRTSVGLIAIGRHLTRPMTGVERTVDESSIRFPTRAFERLASCHTDLDVLESALDRLSGTAGTPVIENRRGTGLRPGRTVFDATAAPTMSTPRTTQDTPRTRQETAPDLRANGDTDPMPSRGPAAPLDNSSRRVASRNGSPGRSPAPETDASPSDLSSLATAANDSAVKGSAAGKDERRDSTRGPRSGSKETPADGSNRAKHENQIREGTLRHRGPRVGDASASETLDFEPGGPGAPGLPVEGQLAPRGALGDLVRRAGSKRYHHLAPNSADAAQATDSATYLPVERAHRDPQDGSKDDAQSIHLIEVFEFAMDELVRREAERHGFEGEL